MVFSSISCAVVLPQSGVVQRYNDTIYDIVSYKNNKSDTSLGLRFEMWKSAWLAIQEKPVIGWGRIGYQQKKELLIAQNEVTSKIRDFNHVHNQYLNSWVEQGLLGISSLVLVFAAPLMVCIRYVRFKSLTSSQFTLGVLGCIHISAVISYCLSQGFMSHNSGSIFYFFVVSLFVGCLLSIKNLKRY